MKNIAIWVPDFFYQDELFSESSPLNRDDTLSSYRLLRDTFKEKGWECHTQDVYKKAGVVPDAVLFINIPKLPVAIVLGAWARKSRKYVLLNESELIQPQSWNLNRHKEFDKIFTWNDELVDNDKYYKINFPQNFSMALEPLPFAQKKLCTMIAGHKLERHPLELYSKRIEAIRWFESNHPEDFDLYGVGWDEYRFYWPKPLRILNRIKPLVRRLAPAYPSYRGRVGDKRKVLQKYKFSICYENAFGITGYITEKIFDSFLAGCVPVYWGAPNIAEHVPEDCFIDRQSFSSYEDLYEYLSRMPVEEYDQILGNIHDFICNDKAIPFSEEYFSSTIVEVISGDA